MFVAFRLRDHDYAFPLATVREVLRMVAIVEVPDSPGWVAGVINLRGRTVPVIDLSARLGLGPQQAGLDTAIIVTESALRGPVAFLADEVTDVVGLPADSIDEIDEPAGTAHSVFATARRDERLTLVLAVDRLVGNALEPSLPAPSS